MVFSMLYSGFNAVSVREDSALTILKQVGCTNPIPKQVLDPTMLLTKEDYYHFFKNNPNKKNLKNKIFCYILDVDAEKQSIIDNKVKELNMEAFVMGISSDEEFNVSVWLESIYDSSFVITDSYHGVFFSLLFNKKFLFCGNSRRGNARVESLFRLLEVTEDLDYNVINANIEKMRKTSLSFLENSLK